MQPASWRQAFQDLADHDPTCARELRVLDDTFYIEYVDEVLVLE